MRTQQAPGTVRERPQARVNATFPPESTTWAGNCRACLKPLGPGSGLRYCSGRCRLRGWAVRELAKALQEGTVDGLRSELRASIVEIVKEEK